MRNAAFFLILFAVLASLIYLITYNYSGNHSGKKHKAEKSTASGKKTVDKKTASGKKKKEEKREGSGLLFSPCRKGDQAGQNDRFHKDHGR